MEKLRAPDIQRQSEGRTFEQLNEEERAEIIPSQIFDFKSEAPAFIFSKENLVQIRNYTRAVWRLPPDRMSLEASANFDILKLNIEDISVFHENLRKHAASWRAIESSCKRMGSDLQVFAENFLAEGNDFVRHLNEHPALKISFSEAGDWARSALPLSTSESTTFQAGVELYIGHIKKEITDKLEAIRAVKALIESFEEVIPKNLQPMADGLADSLRKHNPSGRIAGLGALLDELDTAIKDSAARYSQLVGFAFTGLVFGPAGLIITGGIFGSKAEAERAEKNKLIKERERVAAERASLADELGSFEHLQGEILDIRFRLVDVITAVKHLEDVWILLEAYAKTSLNNASTVTTRAQLMHFVITFQRIVRPWKSILKISQQLSLLFNVIAESD
ncbi:alpha-xenorhabdolysin family binary toxin subunit A [Pseudomonas sp.]|uniref:alpha-xenorhabdolysin family binary toxin subunit A n=1 Tax=Pseudomonas sp. TaxID=306 RepID=UPI0028B1B6ED|nr:alpha-xenorhabdolysin family binary toxin subunit A [Pseudomonas sp.]